MQDNDDFDPLDDLLLSDDEPPIPKPTTRNSISHLHADSIDDDETRRNKKKKMLAELFGSNDAKDGKAEVLPVTSSSKSDWLDLKNDSPQINEATDIAALSGKYGTDEELSRNFGQFSQKENTFKEETRFADKSVRFVENENIFSRHESENTSAKETRKSLQQFKTTNVNSSFDFDRTLQSESSYSKPASKMPGESTYSENEESSYIPSLGLNRRSSSSKGRTLRSSFEETKPMSFVLKLLFSSFSSLADSLPSWLEPNRPKTNTEPEKPVSVIKSKEINSVAAHISSDAVSPSEKNLNDEVKAAENTTSNSAQDYDTSNFVSLVSQLVKRQKDLKKMAKSQVHNLSAQEQEIRNAALELMKQQRDSVKALIQILSVEDVLHDSNVNSSNPLVGSLEMTQLQTRLMQQQLEKVEVEMQLKHAERKYKIDLSMMEDLYKYKLQIAEEKETHFKAELVSLQEEFDAKLLKRKEAEDELIQAYNEKIRALQEEHLTEVKRIIELHNLKSSFKPNGSEKKNIEEVISKELAMREIAMDDRQKELLEFEERLSREKIALDTNKASFDARIEEFEMKSAKERLHFEQMKKDLKLAQNIFNEKEACWEREKQREKSYLSACKQELEVLKENLLIDERKLMKEKFEITTEKARLEAIMMSEGGSNRISDVIQTRAELQGTVDEVRRLKSKLESERKEIKNEETRLREETWRLRSIEQELSLQNKHFQKLLQEAESKRDEGIRALKKAQLIESQMNERMEQLERRMMELNRREELLTQEKIEISKERDLLNKKKYQLDMILPQLTYDEQLPYSVLNKVKHASNNFLESTIENVMDPRIMIMKLKAENDLNLIN